MGSELELNQPFFRYRCRYLGQLCKFVFQRIRPCEERWPMPVCHCTIVAVPNQCVAFFMLVLAVLAMNGCAGTQPASANEADDSPPGEELVEVPIDDAVVAEHASDPAEVDPELDLSTTECGPEEDPSEHAGEPVCVATETTDEALLDRTQRTVHELADNTTRWFDGFFGQAQLAEGEHVSRGRLTVSGLWDQRDGFDTRFNLRAKIALPALENRTRVIFGRGDTDDIVDGTTNEGVEGLPGSFDDDRDDEWLVGLGFNRSGDISRGLDFGVGVRITSPPEPYVNVTYRWAETWDNSWSFRSRARTFWQNQRGTGVTLDSDLNYAVSPTLILRWASNFGVEDRVEGLGWRNDIIAYQGLSNNRAFSYGVFAQGETAAEVQLQNVGFELRFRRRVAREWFFIQLSTGLSWPREFLDEVRESNFGVGISFEMQFGRWQERSIQREDRDAGI